MSAETSSEPMLTPDRIIGIAVIASLGFMAFSERTRESQSENQIDMVTLSAKMENIQESVNKLTMLSEEPRFTANDYDVRTQPIFDKVVTLEAEQNRRAVIIDDWRAQANVTTSILENHSQDIISLNRRLRALENVNGD